MRNLSSFALALLVAIACGCSDVAPPPECAGASCTCKPGEACDTQDSACVNESCSLACVNDNTCTGSCGASCTVSCAGGSSCDMTVGPSSSVSCAGGSTCAITCTDSCSLSCSGGAKCTLTCGSGSPKTIAEGGGSCP